MQLLSVGLYLRSEEDEDARSFIGNMDITYPIGIAVDEESFISAYGNGITPMTVFITADGKIFKKIPGVLTEENLITIVNELFFASGEQVVIATIVRPTPTTTPTPVPDRILEPVFPALTPGPLPYTPTPTSGDPEKASLVVRFSEEVMRKYAVEAEIVVTVNNGFNALEVLDTLTNIQALQEGFEDKTLQLIYQGTQVRPPDDPRSTGSFVYIHDARPFFVITSYEERPAFGLAPATTDTLILDVAYSNGSHEYLQLYVDNKRGSIRRSKELLDALHQQHPSLDLLGEFPNYELWVGSQLYSKEKLELGDFAIANQNSYIIIRYIGEQPITKPEQIVVGVGRGGLSFNSSLVRDWSVDESGSKYTLRIAQGLVLQEGGTFNASAVRQTLDENKGLLPSFLDSQVIDDFSIVITFSRSDHTVLSELLNVGFDVANDPSPPTPTPIPVGIPVGGWYIEVPQTGIPLTDPRVQSAIDFAINEAAVDPDFYYFANWPSLEGALQSYDPDRAKQLLLESGYWDDLTNLCIDIVDNPSLRKPIDPAKTIEIFRFLLSNVGIVVSQSGDSCESGRIIIVG